MRHGKKVIQAIHKCFSFLSELVSIDSVAASDLFETRNCIIAQCLDLTGIQASCIKIKITLLIVLAADCVLFFSSIEDT